MEIFLPFAIFSNFLELENVILVHSDQTHLGNSCILLLWYLPILYFTGYSGISLKPTCGSMGLYPTDPCPHPCDIKIPGTCKDLDDCTHWR